MTLLETDSLVSGGGSMPGIAACPNGPWGDPLRVESLLAEVDADQTCIFWG
jgi:hypothetical protein